LNTQGPAVASPPPPPAVAGPGQLGQAVRSMRAEKMDEQNSPAIRRTRTWQMRYQTASRKRDRGETLPEILVPLFAFVMIASVALPKFCQPRGAGLCRDLASGALAIPATYFFLFVLDSVLPKVFFRNVGEKFENGIRALGCASLIPTWLVFAVVFQNIFWRINPMWYAHAVFVYIPILLTSIWIATIFISERKSPK